MPDFLLLCVSPVCNVVLQEQVQCFNKSSRAFSITYIPASARQLWYQEIG